MRRCASTARLKRGPAGPVLGSSPLIDERGYTRAMRHLAVAVTFAFAVMAAPLLSAQTQERMKPTAPGTPGDPTWQGVVRLTDGRTFVTDGGLAIDAAIAKPAKLPARELAPRALEGFLNAAHKEECSFSDLTAVAAGRTYTTPGGVALNATYINYLRRTLPTRSVRFRMTAPMQPVVVAENGKAVAVLMPVKQ
jgi:hypothetical protein